MTALLLVHGRSQQMPMELDHSPASVASYAAAKKREWLAGLAKGLTLADAEPVAARDAYFPFYGNLLADQIAQHEAAGRRRPDLESTAAKREEQVAQHTADMVIELAQSADFVASRRLTGLSEEDARDVRRVEEHLRAGDEAGFSDVLKSKFARQALQFLADKTDSPEWIIERFLRDVAYAHSPDLSQFLSTGKTVAVQRT